MVTIVISTISLTLFIGLATFPNYKSPNRVIPWLGVITIAASIASLASGFGLAGWTSYTIVTFCIVQVPIVNGYFSFLSNSISSFLLRFSLAYTAYFTLLYLKYWRLTDRKWEVHTRIVAMFANTTSETLSIFLTSLVPFAIGAIRSPYTGIKTFCIMSLITLTTLFFIQICFFPACFYFIGAHEKKFKQGCLCWRKIMPRSDNCRDI